MLGAIDDGAKLADILGFADKGEGDIVDLQFKTDCDIGEVFGGESWEVDFNAGEVDVAAAAESAAGEDFAFDFVGMLGEDFHFNFAVVDEDGVTNGNVVDEVVVIDIDGVEFLAGFAANGEPELLARVEVESGFEVTSADGGPLCVHKNAGVLAEIGGGSTNGFDDGAGPVMSAVGHVEAEDIDASGDHIADHFGGFSGGAEGGDNLRLSHVRCGD